MKYSIKVNEVRAKEGSNIKGFATVVFGDSFKITNIADVYKRQPESYASNRDYVSAKGMTLQETPDEDRMVTQAEYGAEIEAETSEKDPSELQYITPIDYAKRIAELDEDLRDAAEILVTDCSCYTPFRAFPVSYTHLDVYKRQHCGGSSRHCSI